MCVCIVSLSLSLYIYIYMSSIVWNLLACSCQYE